MCILHSFPLLAGYKREHRGLQIDELSKPCEASRCRISLTVPRGTGTGLVSNKNHDSCHPDDLDPVMHVEELVR
jgi:hypothetical protein